MLKVTAYTMFDFAQFNVATGHAMRDFASSHGLDPKSILAFSEFWKSQKVDPATLIHLGVATYFPSLWLGDYGINVNDIITGYYNYGNIACWRNAVKSQPERRLTTELLPKLKGLHLYALLK
jgi:hypothetical protein